MLLVGAVLVPLPASGGRVAIREMLANAAIATVRADERTSTVPIYKVENRR